jgi:hypothetical protein
MSVAGLAARLSTLVLNRLKLFFAASNLLPGWRVDLDGCQAAGPSLF